MDARRRAFYEYHAALMEPWDGPAAVAFTDGQFIGATLDRNGLRPARYFVTDDDLIVMSSEMGVLDIPQEKIIKQGAPAARQDVPGRHRARPHRRRRGAEARPRRAAPLPGLARPHAAPARGPPDRRTSIPTPDTDKLLERQQAFGYTQEDLKMLLAPMASAGEEPLGSMGNDTPLAVLSDRPKPLFAYFKQLFAQVTNPPIDPIREELVMSLVSFIGPRPNLLSPDATEPVMRLEVSQPILTIEDLEKLRRADESPTATSAARSSRCAFPAEWGADGVEPALDALCADAEDAVREGVNIIILTDRDLSRARWPSRRCSPRPPCTTT